MDYRTNIKWSRNLKTKLKRGLKEHVASEKIVPYAYRPFLNSWLYCSELMIDEVGQMQSFDADSGLIATPATGDFRALATDRFCDFHFIGDSRVYAAKRISVETQRIVEAMKKAAR